MNDYLEHHGILGQKWGKQNGPPYPLSLSKLSKKERSSANSTFLKKKSAEERQKIERKNETGGNPIKGIIRRKKERDTAKIREGIPDSTKNNEHSNNVVVKTLKVASAEDVYKHRRELTTDEINAWAKRIEAEAKIVKIMEDEKKAKEAQWKKDHPFKSYIRERSKDIVNNSRDAAVNKIKEATKNKTDEYIAMIISSFSNSDFATELDDSVISTISRMFNAES